jgi:hypothetical protein
VSGARTTQSNTRSSCSCMRVWVRGCMRLCVRVCVYVGVCVRVCVCVCVCVCVRACVCVRVRVRVRLQVKRNRDLLRPYLLDAGILPDPSQRDTDLVTIAHLHKLAKHWGLLAEDPDFLRKFANERMLCQVLVEQSSTRTLEDAAAQVRGWEVGAGRARCVMCGASGGTCVVCAYVRSGVCSACPHTHSLARKCFFLRVSWRPCGCCVSPVCVAKRRAALPHAPPPACRLRPSAPPPPRRRSSVS